MLRLGLLAAVFGCLLLGARPSVAAAPAAPADRPRLVVLLTIDQMRADYPQWYGRAWRRGLRRLFREGSVFTDARYPFLNTVTCAGHGTIGTGAFPQRHGMVLNAWWSRELGRNFECTEDVAAPTVYYGAPPVAPKPPLGHSAANLRVPTLVEVMKGAVGPGLSPRPRVASFSAKARSAIGLVGGAGDVVAWFDDRTWTTSRKYASAPDPLVARVLARHPVEALTAKPWQRYRPARLYRFRDDAPHEHPPVSFWQNVFPHSLTVPPGARATTGTRALLSPLGAWARSGLVDAVLVELATAALTDLELGQGPGTDVLAVSFSALDVVGHAFGPRSHEVQDVLLRLDDLLGDLLATLDRRVGRDNYLLAFTSDHGVGAIPEDEQDQKVDAGRIDVRAVEARVEAAVVAELGPGDHVKKVLYTDIYLDKGVFARLRAKAGAVDRVKAVIRALPGVTAAFATDELATPGSDPHQRAAALGHFPGRSGDLILVPRPHWMTVAHGTTHGTANDYDQHVPLVLLGRGVRRGRHATPASPADVAPTIAHVLGLALPSAQGRVLDEAFGRAAAGRPARSARKPTRPSSPAAQAR